MDSTLVVPTPATTRGGWLRQADKLGHMFAIEFRQTMSRRTEWIGRTLFFVMLMLIFSRLWLAVQESGKALSFNGQPVLPADMLWYLAGTEWIALGVPLLHLEFERDIRSGDICYRLGRPVPYLWSRFAEGLGATCARFIMVGVVAVVCTRIHAGEWPRAGWAAFAAVPFGLLAALLLLCFKSIIGLSAVWMEDVSPGFWVLQKLMFFFGGLMFPIWIYPPWMQHIAEWTPFYPLLCGTGTIASGTDLNTALGLLLRLGVWLMIALLLLRWVYARALLRVEVNGG